MKIKLDEFTDKEAKAFFGEGFSVGKEVELTLKVNVTLSEYDPELPHPPDYSAPSGPGGTSKKSIFTDARFNGRVTDINVDGHEDPTEPDKEDGSGEDEEDDEN